MRRVEYCHLAGTHCGGSLKARRNEVSILWYQLAFFCLPCLLPGSMRKQVLVEGWHPQLSTDYPSISVDLITATTEGQPAHSGGNTAFDMIPSPWGTWLQVNYMNTSDVSLPSLPPARSVNLQKVFFINTIPRWKFPLTYFFFCKWAHAPRINMSYPNVISSRSGWLDMMVKSPAEEGSVILSSREGPCLGPWDPVYRMRYVP